MADGGRVSGRRAGLQCNPPDPEPLQRRLFLIDERHHDVAVLGRIAAADDDDVAVQNAGLDHGIALHLQREVLPVGEQVGRAGDVVGVVLDGADGRAGGNAAHDRHRYGAGVDDGRRRRRQIAGAAALDDARLESGAPGRARIPGVLR